MSSVCFYFQVHQPFRLKPYDCFMIGYDHFYEGEEANRKILDRVSNKCYLPANKAMLQLIKKHKGAFKVAYSISGIAIEQFERYRPDVLESFKELAETKCVEFISETYHHSLSFLFSKDEFVRQVGKHKQKIEEHFNQTPRIFRNTELVYNNDLAKFVNQMGFSGIICEGVDRNLRAKSPNFVYRAPHNYNFKCLLRNYKLSDDIAFRFSDRKWSQFPLTAIKFADWIRQEAFSDDVVNLFMDYETFGEHQWSETGIFDFLKQLPKEILKTKNIDFKTPSEAVDSYPAHSVYNSPDFCSWADTERDLSAWLGNSLQLDAAERIYQLEKEVKETGDEKLLNTWSQLLTSDHLYYMCTKYWSDGDVHKYFSPYDTPYDAYINYMNIVTDLEERIENRKNKLQVVVSKEQISQIIKGLARLNQSESQEVIEPSFYV